MWITLALDEHVTCTITNNDIAPTLTVNKVVVNNYRPDSGLFNLTIDGGSYATDVGDGGTTDAVAVDAGSHSVSETAGTATSLSDNVTTIGGDCASNESITLALAQNAVCTITNTAKAMAEVYKTSQGAPAQGFSFEIRQGASTTAAGTTLEEPRPLALPPPSTPTGTSPAEGVPPFSALRKLGEITASAT